MSEPSVKLPQNADELLRDFPVAEPDFDAQAKAIEARLKGSPGGLVFDDLLRAPTLAAEPGEPAAPSSARASSLPKSNFAEMARKSVQKGDNDRAQLAKELIAATASSRRPDAEMVERVRAAGRPAVTSTPLPSSDASERTSGVVARTAAAAAAAAAPTQPPKARPTKTHPGTIIGIVGTALALAACLALFIRSGQPDAPTSAALAAEKAADAPGAVAPHTVGPAPAAAKPADGVMSPDQLAAAPPVAVPEAAKAGGAKAATAGAPIAGVAAKAAPAPSGAAKQEAVVLEDDPEPQKKPAAAAPKPEAAPEPQLRPAEGSATDVPLSPSAGAVSTALSSVRGSAQACLAGQSDPVTAVVTFGADGHVLRVSAAGPSGACIQAALMKAHIAPFAKESFSASTTIRPP